MGNQIYSKNEFIIIKVGNEYVVINRNKDFKNGHSHIKNFNTAKYIIDMVIHKRIPNHLPIYLLISLLRISDDDDYKTKIQDLIDVKNNRNQKYTNRAC